MRKNIIILIQNTTKYEISKHNQIYLIQVWWLIVKILVLYCDIKSFSTHRDTSLNIVGYNQCLWLTPFDNEALGSFLWNGVVLLNLVRWRGRLHQIWNYGGKSWSHVMRWEGWRAWNDIYNIQCVTAMCKEPWKSKMKHFDVTNLHGLKISV